MIVKFWMNFNKSPDSTARPATDPDYTYDLKLTAGCSVLAPVLRLTKWERPSYAYIDKWDRYYFVNDPTYAGVEIYLPMQIDVLASWRTKIRASSQYVLRAAGDFDGEITDGLYPVKQPIKTASKTIITPWDSPKDGCYVIGTIGGDGLTKYQRLTPDEFTAFVRYAFSDDFFAIIRNKAPNLLKAQINPMQYLSSVTWFPFFVSGEPGGSAPIKLGWWETTIGGTVVAPYTEFTVSIPCAQHPEAATRGKYLLAAPYTRHTLNALPWGEIDLSANIVQGFNVIGSIVVDSVTGVGRLELTTTAGEYISTHYAQVGVPVQVSQVLADYLGGVTSIAGGVATAMAGNYVGSVAGIVDGLVSMSAPRGYTKGSNGGRAGVFGDWTYQVEFGLLADEDNTHLGRPLMQRRTLSSLPGYIKCDNAHFSAAQYREENDRIEAYMNGGFYNE